MSDLQIITKTKHDENGWELAFDHNFNLINKKAIRKEVQFLSLYKKIQDVGTEIFIKNLFRELPVRYQEFKANYQHQFAKAVSLVESYALICTGIKIVMVNSTQEKT